MKLEDTGAIVLTPLEFCHKTRIDPKNWIFENVDLDNAKFYMYGPVVNQVVNEPERYFFNDGKAIWEFKHMEEYEETWVRTFDMTAEKPGWSLWNTWKVW